MADLTTIWKFPFAIEDEFWLDLPGDAQVLHVAMQQSTPCLWAAVAPDADVIPRRFAVRGTGHSLPSGAHHVATFSQPPFVWHLFAFPGAG